MNNFVGLCIVKQNNCFVARTVATTTLFQWSSIIWNGTHYLMGYNPWTAIIYDTWVSRYEKNWSGSGDFKRRMKCGMTKEANPKYDTLCVFNRLIESYCVRFDYDNHNGLLLWPVSAQSILLVAWIQIRSPLGVYGMVENF